MSSIVSSALRVAVLVLIGGALAPAVQQERTSGTGRPFGSTGRDRPFGSVGRTTPTDRNRPFGAVGRARPLGSLSDRPQGSIGRDRPFGGADELAERIPEFSPEDRERRFRDRRNLVVFWWSRAPIWELRSSLGAAPQPLAAPEPLPPALRFRGPILLPAVHAELAPRRASPRDRAEVAAALDASPSPGGRLAPSSFWSRVRRSSWSSGASRLPAELLRLDPRESLGAEAEVLLRALEEALRRDPEDLPALWLHAAWHAGTGEFAPLELDLRSLRQLRPEDPRLRDLEERALELLARR